MQRRAAQRKSKTKPQQPGDQNLDSTLTVDGESQQSSSNSEADQERQAEATTGSNDDDDTPIQGEVESCERANKNPEVSDDKIDTKEADVGAKSPSDHSEDDPDAVETLGEAEKFIDTTDPKTSDILKGTRWHHGQAWTETKTNYDSRIVINVNTGDSDSPSGSGVGRSDASLITDLSSIELTDKKKWDIELETEQVKTNDLWCC